ncbi:hypothetical protein ACTUVN_002092 [Pseudomonas caspiana]
MTNEIDTYLQIKADIEQDYKQTVKANREQDKSGSAEKIGFRVFWFGMVAPSILAVLIAPLGLIEGWRWVFNVSWGLIALSYLILFIYPFLGLWLYRDSLKKLVSSPFACLLEWNVKTVMQVDARHLPRLVALSRDTLKLGALELKNERNSFERRTYIVTGALDKVGIFPGLLALFVGLSTLAKTLTDAAILTSRLDWMFAVAVANIFFYFMCGYSQVMLMRYDRMIALTELALERKQEKGLPEQQASYSKAEAVLQGA